MAGLYSMQENINSISSLYSAAGCWIGIDLAERNWPIQARDVGLSVQKLLQSARLICFVVRFRSNQR